MTEETFNELGDLKKVGQTYDELVQELIESRQRENLREMFSETDDEKFLRIDDV